MPISPTLEHLTKNKTLHSNTRLTCTGLGVLFDEISQSTASREELKRLGERLMDAVWNQPLPSSESEPWVITSTEDAIAALKNGWAYNCIEADNLYTLYGNVRPVVRNGEIAGYGVQAPDGTIIKDGDQLVAWRNQRWTTMKAENEREYLERKISSCKGGSTKKQRIL